jgi:BirA family biotin operon repressor/biotin-[acetyl-CoA-carboxylase] ligase
MCSIFLGYSILDHIPPALTLKTGLAVSLAIEDFLPSLAHFVQVKWPNDVMLLSRETQAARKAVGILTEAQGTEVFIGIGVNLTQRYFQEELRLKAGSLVLAYEDLFPGQEVPEFLLSPNAPQKLLEKVLFRLFVELEDPLNRSAGLGLPWKDRLEERLYKRGEMVCFAQGAADSQNIIQGRLAGIGEGGELLLIPEGEKEPGPFITGELQVY